MLIIPSQEHRHARRRLEGLARQECRRIGPVKALFAIKENHLFRFAFGMQIGDNLQRTARLHQGDFHVQTAQVHAENGAGGRDSRKKEEKEAVPLEHDACHSNTEKETKESC